MSTGTGEGPIPCAALRATPPAPPSAPPPPRPLPHPARPRQTRDDAPHVRRVQVPDHLPGRLPMPGPDHLPHLPRNPRRLRQRNRPPHHAAGAHYPIGKTLSILQCAMPPAPDTIRLTMPPVLFRMFVGAGFKPALPGACCVAPSPFVPFVDNSPSKRPNPWTSRRPVATRRTTSLAGRLPWRERTSRPPATGPRCLKGCPRIRLQDPPGIRPQARSSP